MKAIIETFKPVRGYEGLYEVSDYGCVRSLDYNGTGKRKVMKPKKNKGYRQVELWRDGNSKTFSVHRLVWEAFNGTIPDGMQIDHVNGVRDDNSLANLRVVTPKENVHNPVTRERFLASNREKNRRLSKVPKWFEANRAACTKPVLQLDKVTGEVIREWECSADACRELGLVKSSISACCNGKRNSAGGFKWRFPSDAN